MQLCELHIITPLCNIYWHVISGGTFWGVETASWEFYIQIRFNPGSWSGFFIIKNDELYRI